MYKANKNAIIKWRMKNIDEYNIYQKNYAKQNYEAKYKEKKRLYYLKKKQLKEDLQEFMNILLD